jgi:uncharacterized membrane protein YhaH (DUF805 family)
VFEYTCHDVEALFAFGGFMICSICGKEKSSLYQVNSRRLCSSCHARFSVHASQQEDYAEEDFQSPSSIDFEKYTHLLDANTRIFTMKGRLCRTRFALFSLLYSILWLLFISFFSLRIPSTIVFYFVVYVGIAFFNAILIVKRLHDLEMSGAYYWMLFVPAYDLYLIFLLLFRKGTEGPNRYGIDSCDKVFNLSKLLVILSKNRLIFKDDDERELVMTKQSAQLQEEYGCFLFEGKDPAGVPISQEVPFSALGRKLTKFRYALAGYFNRFALNQHDVPGHPA